MPVHDWSRVDAGVYHDFHNAWMIMLRNELSGGILPRGCYALVEQHAGRYVPNLLTLHAQPTRRRPGQAKMPPPAVAVCGR